MEGCAGGHASFVSRRRDGDRRGKGPLLSGVRSLRRKRNKKRTQFRRDGKYK